MRLILGLIKGGIIGGALGYGFMQIADPSNLGFLNWILYGVIGALVGFICGRPFWRQETLWTPAVKAVFGIAICIGLYALVTKVLGDPNLDSVGLQGKASSFPYILGAVIGVVYGIFVEIDDGGSKKKQTSNEKKQEK